MEVWLFLPIHTPITG